ncbi:uncharacterized protein LOC133290573 [Gastrolobium bilobum]|uniref:uncharacterized protein LOC133290573 n=1 Tax=Gastrolobium bilobum TaxID=150636 RepID=UPI002AB1567A|nr:uncharacterized protein LOC133290573 [Gastrolobium bilobum]
MRRKGAKTHSGTGTRSNEDELNLEINPFFANIGVKIEIPEFEGTTYSDEFIDWLHTVERVFDIRDLTKDQKVKLVAIKLRKHASYWWEHIKKQQKKEGKSKIRSWDKMKKLLQQKFLPIHYRQESSSSTTNTSVGKDPSNPKLVSKGVTTNGGASKTGTTKKRCFKCQGLGHFTADCPNRQYVTLVDTTADDIGPTYDEYEEDQVDGGSEEGEIIYGDVGESLVVRRVLSVDVADDELWL